MTEIEKKAMEYARNQSLTGMISPDLIKGYIDGYAQGEQELMASGEVIKMGFFEQLQKETETLKWEQKQILEDNEYWQEQFTKADKERATLEKAITEFSSVIEKMKCCGNCKKYQIYDADKGIKECWYYYAKEKRCSEKYEKWELAE